MVMSKRERGIFWTAMIVLVLLVSDRLVINPILVRLAAIADEKQQLGAEVDTMRDVLGRGATRQRQWQQMVDNGLMNDPSAAQSSMSHALETWSDRSRVRLTSVTPQRTVSDATLREIVFTIAGKGDMASIGEFIWFIEQTEMPVKITSLTLGSTNASGQDLTLTLKLSLLYRAEEEATKT